MAAMAHAHTQAQAIKAPLPYFGGKQHVAANIVALLPPHRVYVDVFGGAGSILFAKPPSAVETWNDLDSGLVAFFRVLRDPRRARELRRLLDLTPYAREEWAECAATWMDAATDVEMARRWFVGMQGGFGKQLGGASTGWSYSKEPGHDKAHSYRASIDALPRFTARLRHVQIDHDTFERVIRRYDTPDTLMYCDPPYLPETRTRADRYRHEMTREDHLRLLDLLHHVRGMVVLSGYRSELYDGMLAGWERVEMVTRAWAAKGARPTRIECVWRNPAAFAAARAHQPQLWTAEAGASDGQNRREREMEASA